jgi:hypothetical protein
MGCLYVKVINSVQHFLDLNFVISLAYFTDVFVLLNSLNMSLQGTEVTILEAEEKVYSFQEKLPLWGRTVKSRNFANVTFCDKIASNSACLMEPKSVKVFLHTENLKTTTEGIIRTGSVADI